MEGILQMLGIIFSAATPLVFAAPRLPYLKEYIRPISFEEGWNSLVVNRSLNHKEEGFIEVLVFILVHNAEDGRFANVVAEDTGIEIEDSISNTSPSVEEIRIMTKPSMFKEQILLCYDEDTKGPLGELNELPNIDTKLPSTEDHGEDWRWFAPLSAVEYNAQKHTWEQIDRWTNYGAATLALGVLFQILAITF